MKIVEYVAPLQGAFFVFVYLFPRALPWAGMFVPYRDGRSLTFSFCGVWIIDVLDPGACA